VIHNTDPNAKCIDGSAPSVYFHQGTEKNKFLIYFIGGGYCMGNSISEVLESCYKRSKTDFGSSKNLPDTYQGQGYLSTDPEANKFASWTKVIVNYCDGAFHASATKTPYRYKDAELYFHGADITRSHFKWLMLNYDFASAEKVLLTGSSAGGSASWLWSTYVNSLLTNPMALSVVADSTTMMNVPTVSGDFKLLTQTENLFKITNVDEKTPLTTCNRFKAGEEYKCISLEFAWTSLTARILLISSQYDSWFIYNGTEINCVIDGKEGKTLANCSSSEIANIENNRKALLNFFGLFGQLSRNSIWAISCSNHMYTQYDKFYDSPNQKVPGQTGDTIRAAVERFVLNGERVALVDNVAWPGNAACAY
jgi:hypothetical protein